MLLNIVKPIVAPYVAWATWLKQETDRANRVALAREYADGEHRSSLTEEMRNLLRIKKAELGAPFNLNHMDNIIQTVVDRLAVTAIESDNPDTTTWLSDVLNDNRFDGLQIDAHEAAVRDGDAYIMVSFDNGVKMTLEDAFDGTSGIVMIYGADKQAPLLALKIWQETTLVSATGSQRKTAKLITRVNAYFPDRVEKYVSYNNQSIYTLPETLDQDMSWTMITGDPIGIPIIHFKNRSAKNRNGGKSEIRDAIPLQDAINRTLTSMIMSSELTSFPIRYSIGLKPPTALTPGMWINAYIRDETNGAPKEPTEKQLDWFKSIRFGTLEPGQIMPFIEQSKFAIEQMYTITRTPRTDGVDGGASGESLKQREIGLVGKVNRCHVSFGNAWENVAVMAWRVQSAYGNSQPPEYSRMATRWQSAEIRNDTETVDNVLKIADRLDERTVLELLAPVFKWDTGKIDAILNARRGDAGSRLADLAKSLPTFDTFNGQTLAV